MEFGGNVFRGGQRDAQDAVMIDLQRHLRILRANFLQRKVIGKQGKIAQAIRTVVKAAASGEDKKVIVDILQ